MMKMKLEMINSQVIIMVQEELENKKILHQKYSTKVNGLRLKKRKIIKKRCLKLQNSKIITKKPSRFRCWSCGLSEGDAELCLSCPFENNYTPKQYV